MSTFEKILRMFVVAAVLGTAYDFVHVYYGVLSYERPDFFGTALWFVPVEFGLAGVAAAFAGRALSFRFAPPPIGVMRTTFDASLLLAAYFCTGVFVGDASLVFGLLAVLVVASVVTRPSPFVLVATVAGAVLGPLCELGVSGAGIFHYNYASPLPIWLPLLWAIAIGLFIDLAALFKFAA